MKMILAAMLFFTSVTIEQQVIVKRGAVDVDWVTTIGIGNNAFAALTRTQLF